MSEESKTRDVIDSVTGLAKAIPVYQDLLQPAIQEVGKDLQTVAKLVHVALAPVSALVWGYDKMKDFVYTTVANRLKNVPPENIITPKANLAGPLLDSLRYTGHEPSLSELYANLLAASMDKATAEGAHPAFVEIIRQLTPDEAKLVGLFLRHIQFPLLDVLYTVTNPPDNIPGDALVLSNYSHLGIVAGCQLPKMTPTYIDNICRLGLSEVPKFYRYTQKGVYDQLEKDPFILYTVQNIEKNEKLKATFDYKALRITDFGRLFANICVKSKC